MMFIHFYRITPMAVLMTAFSMFSLPSLAAEDSSALRQQLIELQQQMQQSQQTYQSRLQALEQRLIQLEQDKITPTANSTIVRQ